jgi:hypothetical protein
MEWYFRLNVADSHGKRRKGLGARGAGAPPPSPPRADRPHRTYAPERAEQCLSRPSLADKQNRPAEIRKRDLSREEQRIEREAGYLSVSEPSSSDDDSEIKLTAKDEEAVRKEQSKNKRKEDGAEDERDAKKPRVNFGYLGEEQDISNGLPPVQGFHFCLMEAASVQVPVPLHVFTITALEFFNQRGPYLPTTKIRVPGEKAVRIIDYEHPTVQAVIGKEADLDFMSWMQAARNFLRWCQEWDPLGQAFARWQQHFLYLCQHRDCSTHFQAVLSADIEARNEYVGTPTRFCARRLSEAVARHRQVIDIEKLMAKWEASHASHAIQQAPSVRKRNSRRQRKARAQSTK